VPVDGWPGTAEPPRPRLIAPPGAGAAFRRLCAASGMREGHIENAFRLEEYDPSATSHVGDIELRFQPVPHFLPTHAIDISSPEGRVTYSADSSPSEDLCAFARETDLLLIEATLPRPEREGPRGHLTPEEAGEHGRRAGARRVVITHMSDELDADWAREQAERGFGGPVELAHEGAVYRL
jgi:ribonuclease BN (tRNA processing enzyme)